MNKIKIICFEDTEVDNLRPITLARPAYAVTSASFRLLDWLKRVPGALSGHIRPYLNQIQELDYELETIDYGDLNNEAQELLDIIEV